MTRSRMLDLGHDQSTFAVASVLYLADTVTPPAIRVALSALDISMSAREHAGYIGIDKTNTRLSRLADAGYAYRIPKRTPKWHLSPAGRAWFEAHVGLPEPSGWCVHDRAADVWHAIPAGLDLVTDGEEHPDWVPILCARTTGEGVRLAGPLVEREPTCPDCKETRP